MAVIHKLYQRILSYHIFQKNIRYLTKQFPNTTPNTRKTISLNVIIAENINIYEKIKGNVTNIEWQSIREKCLQIQQITSATVDSTIIDMCLTNFQVDNAINYFKFLRENNYPLNMAIIGKYLRLYVLKRNSLTDTDKMEIVETVNTLQEKHPYLDSITAEHCIASLCLTDQWEKTHEIIKMMKVTANPGTSVYSALACAAFRNGKSDTAWEALSEIASRNLTLQDIVYTSHLQYCKEGMEIFNNRLRKIFNFWAEYSIMPYNRIINMYADAANKYGWSTAPTTISKTGKCTHCGNPLSKIEFNERNFPKLAKSVMDRIIIGSNIYCKTNPQELLRFKTFIENTKPYDIVIDGLNLTYIRRNCTPTLQTLVQIVQYFSGTGKRILVLTRKHQKKLPVLKYIQAHAFVFLTDNLSADDPYLLYATMASGKNAKFVSLDLMRQHKHSLKDLRLQQEFKIWQYSHQYLIKITSATSFSIMEPIIHVPTAQKNNNHWHIPYVNDDFTYAESYQFPEKWYCLRENEKI